MSLSNQIGLNMDLQNTAAEFTETKDTVPINQDVPEFKK